MPFLDTSSSTFRTLRERGAYLVDKSLFIRDLVNCEQSTVIPRPRRFGKSTNLSMAAEFFDITKKNQAELFKGMKILEDSELCAEHMGKHPVILLSLKEWQPSEFAELKHKLCSAMSSLVGYHRDAWSALTIENRAKMELIASRQATIDDVQDSLSLLCQALLKFHGAQPIVIIDEYDAPIHAAFAEGFYTEAIKLLRPWLSAVFKDNEIVFKSCLTGILRISRESLFSGLNNVTAHTILSTKPVFRDKFGFTEEEVRQMLCDFSKEDHMNACRDWYNGYKFGPHTIYNPFSICNFVADPDSVLKAHWVNSSGNTLIWEQLRAATDSDRRDMQNILAGDVVRREINEATHLALLPQSDALWSLLVLSGYLKASEPKTDEFGETSYHLELPNREVLTTFRRFVTETFAEARISSTDLPFKLLAADRIPELQENLQSYFKGCASYFDQGKIPENFVHGLFFGICAQLRDDFIIHSNPETGKGRADLLMIPRNSCKNLSAKVIELKIAKPAQTIEAALAAAFQQIEDRDYAAKLREAQCAKLVKIAIAVKDKEMLIEVR